MSKALQSHVSARHQQGISLLVVLVLLLVMSVLGIAVLRSSAMQERMSANMVDRNEAVQAAETGLAMAATSIRTRDVANPMWNGNKTFTDFRAGTSCANGYCDRSDPTGSATTTWQVAPSTPAAWTTMPNGARYGFIVEFLGNAKGESSEVRGVCNTSSAPRYLCERPMFRVTSYGRGRGVAQVVLQSNIISQPL